MSRLKLPPTLGVLQRINQMRALAEMAFQRKLLKAAFEEALCESRPFMEVKRVLDRKPAVIRGRKG